MAMIEIIEGYHQGKSLEIEGSATLGRAPNNSLCLHDSRASRQHALIRTAPDGEGFVISDLGSGNGTFVGGTKLQPGIPHALKDGDLITIASTRLLFRLEPKVSTGDTEKRKKHTSSAIFVNNRPVPVIMESSEGSAPAISCTFNASQDMLAPQQDEDGATTIRRLQAMVELATDLARLPGQEAMLDRVMNKIFDVFPQADRAFVMLRNRDTDQMVPILGRERNVSPEDQKGFPISSTIVNRVVKEKQSVLSADAQQDFGTQRSIVDLAIRAMMCAPLICKDEILGVINVDTTTADKSFAPPDLAMLTAIASQTATALKNAALFDQVEAEIQTRSQLSRYMSPDVAKGIVDGTVSANLGGKRATGTLLRCAIDGFADIAESASPEPLIEKINRHFRITTDIIARNQGTLDRFDGDVIKAFWNVMFPDEEPALHAVTTALQLQSSAWYFNLDLRAEGLSPIALSIGLNTGEFAAGNIGGERVEYAVIGKPVRLAAQIEARAATRQILATAATYEPIRAACVALALPPLPIPGRKEPVQLYSIRGLRTGDAKMSLNIPARILDARENLLGEGLITGANGAEDKREVFFSAEAVLVAGQEILLDLDLAEHDAPLRLTGVIEDETRDTYYGQAVFSKSTLRNLTGDKQVFEFLLPGSLIQATRTWETMKR